MTVFRLPYNSFPSSSSPAGKKLRIRSRTVFTYKFVSSWMDNSTFVSSIAIPILIGYGLYSEVGPIYYLLILVGLLALTGLTTGIFTSPLAGERLVKAKIITYYVPTTLVSEIYHIIGSILVGAPVLNLVYAYLSYLWLVLVPLVWGLPLL